jgi:hypothetical protein
MTGRDTLAYHNTELITATKCFKGADLRIVAQQPLNQRKIDFLAKI